MRWQPYPGYKPSGVEWLGEVPEHWEIKRLKTAAIVEMGQSPSSADCNIDGDGVPFLQGNAEFGQKYPTPKIYCPNARKFAKEGDYLLSVRAPVGALNIADQDYGIGRGLCAIRMNEADFAKDYGFYVIQVITIGLHAVATGSTYDAVSTNQVACIPCAFPSLSEQNRITAFLDRETERIDALVEKKQRQIDLLQEKRAALISHAVTKGLENIRESRAPQESSLWQDVRVGRVIKLQRGFDITGANESDGHVPVISSGGLSGHSDKSMVNGPGVIVGRKGTLGTVYYVEEDFWPHDTTLWVKEFRGNLPRYVYYFLIHMKLEKLDVGAANPTLNRNHVHPIKVRWPDSEAQEKIATFLDQETFKIDTLITKIQDSIDTLKEYRTALISAAVTGKIDVSEAAA